MSLQILTFCCRNALQHYRKATFVFVEGGGEDILWIFYAIRISLYIIECVYFKTLPLRTINIITNIDDNLKSLMNKNIILVKHQNSRIYTERTTLILSIHVIACRFFFFTTNS